MNTRNLWIVSIIVAMFVVAAVAWALLRGDIAAYRDAAASIGEQQAILEEVKKERQIFREKLDDMAKSARESSDSTLAPKGGAILDMSFMAGKEEALIDQKELRAEKRLAFQIERREAARKKLKKWGAAVAVAELVLLAAVFVVPRRVGGARTA